MYQTIYTLKTFEMSGPWHCDTKKLPSKNNIGKNHLTGKFEFI